LHPYNIYCSPKEKKKIKIPWLSAQHTNNTSMITASVMLPKPGIMFSGEQASCRVKL